MYSNVFIIYDWVRHGSSGSGYCRVARQSLHGSSTTWFQTSRYCCARAEFNLSNLVRQGSSTTFERGLNCWRTMTSASSFLDLSLPLTRELPHSHSRLIENKGFGWNKIQPREDKGAILSWYNPPFLFYNICRLFFLKIAQWNAKEKKKEKSYLIYSVVQSAHMAEILRNIVKSTMNIYLRIYTYVKSHKQQNQHC